MKRIVSVMISLLIISIYAHAIAGSKEKKVTSPITLSMIDNISLKMFMGENVSVIKFKKGRYSHGKSLVDHEEAAIETKKIGDINGDGVNDAAVITSQSGGGGNATIISLCVVIAAPGKNILPDPIILGDRVDVKSVTIESGKVLIDLLTHGPNDPSCCPRLRKTLVYQYSHGKMVENKYEERSFRSKTRHSMVRESRDMLFNNLPKDYVKGDWKEAIIQFFNDDGTSSVNFIKIGDENETIISERPSIKIQIRGSYINQLQPQNVALEVVMNSNGNVFFHGYIFQTSPHINPFNVDQNSESYGKGYDIQFFNGQSWIGTTIQDNSLFLDIDENINLLKNNIQYKKFDSSADIWNLVSNEEEHIKSIIYDSLNKPIKLLGNNKILKWTGQSWVEIMNGLSETNINSLTLNDDNSDEIYAATSSGLYKTIDGGFSWSKTSFRQAVDQFFIVDQNNKIFWILSNTVPYISNDAGMTWKKVNKNLPALMKNMIVKGQGLHPTPQPIAVTSLYHYDYNDKSIILAFCYGYGIYRTEDNGLTWVNDNQGYDVRDGVYTVYEDEEGLILGSYGVMYSKKFNSSRWEKIAIKNALKEGIKGIDGIISYENGYILTEYGGKIVYLDKDNVAVGLNYGLLSHSQIDAFSTTSYNGKPRLMAIIANNNYTDIKNGHNSKMIVTSDDNGKTWDKKYEGISHGNDEFYISPHDNKEIWIFGDNEGASVSIDGGNTWSTSSERVDSMIFDPINPKIKYYCDGNHHPYKITLNDENKSTTPVLLNTNADRIYVNKTINKYLITDKFQLSKDGGWTWEDVSKSLDKDSEHGFSVVSFTDNNIIGSINTQHGYRQNSAHVIMSSDLGSSWKILKTIEGEIKTIYQSPINKKLFIAYKNSTEEDENIRISYSNDEGMTWLPFGVYKLKDRNAHIVDIHEIMYENTNFLYVATSSGLYRTRDNGKNWEKVGGYYSTDSSFRPALMTPPENIDEVELDKDQMKKYFNNCGSINFEVSVNGRPNYLMRNGNNHIKFNTLAKVKVQKDGSVVFIELLTKQSEVSSYIKPNWETYQNNVSDFIQKIKIAPIYIDDFNVVAEGIVTVPTDVLINFISTTESDTQNRMVKKAKKAKQY